jgi:hypothetical protein
MSPHQSVQAVTIAQGNGAKAELVSSFHQFFRLGCTVQK